jgi:hypothetical protein
MMTLPELPSVPSGHLVAFTDQLGLAVAAYLARFRGSSRYHTECDLRCFLAWCAARGLDPLAARRPHLELYIRWMQEIRRFKPSAVSRRFSITTGFYRTCVIAGMLEHSPAERVRRPTVPAESPDRRNVVLFCMPPCAGARVRERGGGPGRRCSSGLVEGARSQLEAITAHAADRRLACPG